MAPRLPRPRRASRRFHARRGIATLEAALLVPLLVFLSMAGIDAVTWLRTSLRLDQVAAGTANMLSQYRTLYTSDFAGVLFPAAQSMAGTLAVSGQDGGMILSGVVNNGDGKGAVVAWQVKTGTEFTSQVGVQGGATKLPSGYQVPAGQTMIAAEAFNQGSFYLYSDALWKGWGGTQTLSTMAALAIYPTRSAALSSVTAGTRPAGVTP